MAHQAAEVQRREVAVAGAETAAERVREREIALAHREAEVKLAEEQRENLKRNVHSDALAASDARESALDELEKTLKAERGAVEARERAAMQAAEEAAKVIAEGKAKALVLMRREEEVRLLPIRPRSRGARRSLRTFPVVTLHPRFPFNV